MADIHAQLDDYDRLLKLVIRYGANRYQRGFRDGNGYVWKVPHREISSADIEQIATLITQLQRKAGGGQ
jgi:hypothetical protein